MTACLSPARRIRRSLSILIAATLCVLEAGSGVRAQTFTTIAPYAMLMDADTGSVLFEKSADQLTSPASLAKIMTAEVVFNEIVQGRLSLEDTFVVSENAWRRGGASAGGSSMFAQLNSKLRIEDLIKGLVIQSGNDAAIVLAEGIAGSEEAFANRMTSRARQLGFEKLTFRNPWGKFDPEQKVTMREMALLSIHVIKTYPEYYKYFGEKEFTWNKIRQQNRNPLLTMDIGADGLKTGNIDDAGFGLVGSAVENGQRLVLAVNGLKTAKDRAAEARKLLSWGFRSFDARTIFSQGESVGAAKVYGGAKGEVPLMANGPVKLLVPRGSGERMSGRVVYQGPLVAPIEEGAEVARLKVFRGNVLALDLPLRAAESVPVGSLTQRALDAGTEFGVGLFRTYVLKK